MDRIFNARGPGRSHDRDRARTGVAAPEGAVRQAARQAAGAKSAGKLAALQSLADASPVVQRTLYTNPNYAPNTTTLGHFTALDAKVVDAEKNARTAVTATGGGTDTPKQVNWKKHPNATTWGYVVEEQFDKYAKGLGWDTQFVMPSARPDYRKSTGGAVLFADLTTLGQSGTGGPHVGGKLATAVSSGATRGNWHAADIVHSGAQPGATAAPIVPNGTVTVEQDKHFGRFKSAIVEDSYDPWLEKMLEYYPKGLSHGDFYSIYGDKQRKEFVRISKEIDSEEDGTSSMEY